MSVNHILGVRFGKTVLKVAVAGMAATAMVGCVHSAPTPPPISTVTYELPSITAQSETKVRQEKGGLELSVVPVNYTAKEQDAVTWERAPEPLAAAMLGGDAFIYMQKTTTPSLRVSPEELRFLVKINNQMPRVFHGAGAVVQFNVGGEVQAVDQRGYTKLQGAIVPPRQEQEIEIVGPPLSALKEKKGVIGVFLYDVVTNQSEAGVVTEKQNFEWYFNYDLESHTDQVPGVKGELVQMTPEQYQQLQMQQAQEQSAQMLRNAFQGQGGAAPGDGGIPPAGPPQ